MAHFIYNCAENILSKLKDCPPCQRMKYTMLSLKAVLLDAEEKQEQEQNQDLRNWLKELQNVFYQIEDSIDEFFEQEGTGKQVHTPFLCSDRTSAHQCKLTRKMKKLCDHLNEIAAKMYKFHLPEQHASTTEVSVRHMRPSWQFHYPLIDDPDVDLGNSYAGFLKDFKESNTRFFHIVGEAGMGKSTLAKFFYNDQSKDPKYKFKFWVCVEEGFDQRRLMKEIYSFADYKEISDAVTWQQLCSKVKRFLEDKLFLLVFQDLSITNLDNSFEFKELLSIGDHRSKILLTTQSEEIADSIGQDKVYATGKQSTENTEAKNPTILKLGSLSKEKESKLFKDYAYRNRQEQNTELTKIEKEIVHKCKGVPLAIKCMGSLLSSKTSIAEWKNVKEKLLAQKDEDDGILPILRLCYNQMPSHLKPCFLHCSQLPDRVLSTNDVIQLWMAHGLLRSPEENNVSMKNIGEKYCMELWSRCFVQEFQEHGLGYWFKLHPLIQKLGHVLTQEQLDGSEKPVTEIKSIAFHVRSTALTNASLTEKCISKFKCLRLLHLGNTDLKEIPKAIGTLKSLRYLNLHGNQKIKRLPNAICDLQSLQTLILESCSLLEELPNDIRNLISLKYLWVTTNKLRLHKNGVGTMTSLQFLAIGGCNNLETLFERPDCLAGLETLMIYDCQTLKSLPNRMRFLKSLENLVIWNCKQLELTLKEVEFRLQRLTIRELPKVKELPPWIKQSRETLTILQIINCPILMIDEVLDEFDYTEMIKIFGCVGFEQEEPGARFEYRNMAVSHWKVLYETG